MKKNLQRLLLWAGFTIAFLAAVVLLGQAIQIASFAYRFGDWSGHLATGVLVAGFLAVLAVPLLAWLRLPRPLTPPDPGDEAAVKDYQRRLARRLRGNRHLREAGIELAEDAGAEEIREALGVLDAQANAWITQKAGLCFVATAISQNGRLDALLVLSIQTRLVWDIAHLYYQRPAPRDLLRLYNNVLLTALLSGQLDNLDLRERIEPVIRSGVAGGLAGMVPGLAGFSAFVFACLLEGSANAFLTLRVGCIARRYCAPLSGLPERSVVGTSATLEAAGLLHKVAFDSSRTVTAAIMGAMRRSGTGVFEEASRRAGASAEVLWGWGRKAGESFFGKGPPPPGETPSPSS